MLTRGAGVLPGPGRAVWPLSPASCVFAGTAEDLFVDFRSLAGILLATTGRNAGWVGFTGILVGKGIGMSVGISILILCLVMVMVLFLAVQVQMRILNSDMDSISKKIDKLAEMGGKKG
jgi:Na+/pantothenate symporter